MAKAKLQDLTLDPKNANKHSQYGTGLLENSTRENGLGRSILISRDNVVIAGNGVVEAAGAIGIEKVQIVETDGNEIIAVKRTDIKSGTPEFYKMALADNIVAQKNIVMDVEVVEALVQEFPEVKAWGGIVTDPPGGGVADTDRAGRVNMGFQLTGPQAAKIKKAIKVSIQVNKAKFQGDNSNHNGNALYYMALDYLKNHK